MHFILFTIFLFTFSNFYFYRRIWRIFYLFLFSGGPCFPLFLSRARLCLLSDVTEVEPCSGFSVYTLAFMFLLTFAVMYSQDFLDVPSLHLAISDFYATDFLVNFLIRKVRSSSSGRLSFLCIWSASGGADESVLLSWLWRCLLICWL